MPTWGEHFPFLSSRDKLKMLQRLAACGPAIEKQFGLRHGAVEAAEMLGCGYYGCVFRPQGLAAGRVLKLTADNLEASTVNYLVNTYSGGDSKDWHDEVPLGIVRYYRIWQMGCCNVLPKQRGFSFKSRQHPVWNDNYRKTIYYHGPGEPHRPYWLIEREELPDVMTGLKPPKISRSELTMALESIFEMQEFARSLGFFRSRWGPEADIRMTMIIQHTHCGDLRDTVSWLHDNSIKFSDYRKIANLGWRDGEVVIRDIGAADTGFLRGSVPEDVEMLGSL